MTEKQVRIEAAKKRVAAAKEAKTRTEEQLKAAEARLADVEADMAKEGVTPETVYAEIQELDAQIEQGLAKVETLTPQV